MLAIFQLTDDPDSRRKQMKAIDNGAVYKDIEKSFFNRLRRMELAVETEAQQPAFTDSQLLETVYTHPERISLPDFIRLASSIVRALNNTVKCMRWLPIPILLAQSPY